MPETAPATTTATTQPAPNGGAPAATTETQAPATPWFGDDPEIKGIVEIKKWTSPADVIKSYRNVEKLVGAPPDQILRIPGKDAKPEDVQAFRSRLGVPDKPEGYEIPIPDEGSKEFASRAAAAFHKAGVPKDAAVAMATWWNEEMSAQVEAGVQEQLARETADLAALHNEYPGQIFDQRVELGKRAVRMFGDALGKDEAERLETIEALEDVIGTAKLIRLFSSIGEKMGEGRFIESGEGTSPAGEYGMTPAGAQAKLNELKSDPEWVRKFNGGRDQHVQEQFQRLTKIIALGRERPVSGR